MEAATKSIATIQALMTPGADLGISGHPVYGYLGFLEYGLRAAKSSELLFSRGFKERSRPLREAMLDGAVELSKLAENDVLEVLKRGQLLLCWPGTTLLRSAA